MAVSIGRVTVHLLYFRKPNEWLPWPIDLLVKEENDRVAVAGAGAGNLYQDLNSKHGGQDGEDHTFFSHRVTDMAFGAGLDRISKVAWGDSVANVHSAAVPPWLVQSEEEYKRYNERQLPRLTGPTGHSKTVQDTWTPQHCRDQNGPSETRASTGKQVAVEREDDTSQAAVNDDPNWLPNFGGVWQEGPRSKTKHEFAKTMPPPRASALQFRPASVYQRRRQVASSARASSVPSSIQPTPGPVAAAIPEATVLLPPPVELIQAPADPIVRVLALVVCLRVPIKTLS